MTAQPITRLATRVFGAGYNPQKAIVAMSEPDDFAENVFPDCPACDGSLSQMGVCLNCGHNDLRGSALKSSATPERSDDLTVAAGRRTEPTSQI